MGAQSCYELLEAEPRFLTQEILNVFKKKPPLLITFGRPSIQWLTIVTIFTEA